MTSVGMRLIHGLTENLIGAPIIAVGFGLGGYIYGKFANLPPYQLAGAFTSWGVAEAALQCMADSLIQNEKKKKIIHVIVIVVSTISGIYQLQQRKLIGSNMMCCVLTLRTIIVLNLIYHTLKTHLKEQESVHFTPNRSLGI
ncbi:MAG: hypothetical protein ACH350_08675 [Parachlamydiaceae bacterium]